MSILKKVALQCISTKLFKICPNRTKSYFNALQNLQSVSACARDFQGRAETGCVYMATALKLALRLQIPQGLHRGAGPVGAAGAAWRLTGCVGSLVPLGGWNGRVEWAGSDLPFFGVGGSHSETANMEPEQVITKRSATKDDLKFNLEPKWFLRRGSGKFNV